MSKGQMIEESLSQPTDAEKGSANLPEVKDNPDYHKESIKGDQKPQGSFSNQNSKTKSSQLTEEGDQIAIPEGAASET